MKYIIGGIVVLFALGFAVVKAKCREECGCGKITCISCGNTWWLY